MPDFLVSYCSQSPQLEASCNQKVAFKITIHTGTKITRMVTPKKNACVSTMLMLKDDAHHMCPMIIGGSDRSGGSEETGIDVALA